MLLDVYNSTEPVSIDSLRQSPKNVSFKTFFNFSFPVLFLSRFLLAKYPPLLPSFLRSFRIHVVLETRRKQRVLPETLFWFLFVIARQVGQVAKFNKRAYTSGQATFTKIYTALTAVSYRFYKNIFLYRLFYTYLCIRVKSLDSYWFKFSRSSGYSHSFVFKNVKFDERFHRLMDADSTYWGDFKVVFSVYTQTNSILHGVFFFNEILKLPYNNVSLRDKGVSSWAKELARLVRKKARRRLTFKNKIKMKKKIKVKK